MECQRDHSGLMPANLITLAHFSVSSAMNFPNSGGVIGIGTPPRSASRALSLGSLRTALISLLSFSTISAGVSFGTPTPCHELASSTGTKSPTVGRSGSASERFAVFTASARSLPSLMYSIDEDRSGHWWGVSKVSLGGHQRPAIRGTGFRNIDPRADARRTAERGGLSLDGLRDAPPFAAKAPPCVPGAGPPAGRRSCA